MPKIYNMKGLTAGDVNDLIEEGAKFVHYEFIVSAIVVSVRRKSDVYFVKNKLQAFLFGLIYAFLSLLIGIWGIPWGPIWTIGAIFKNLSGGKDVTYDVQRAVNLGTRHFRI